MNNIVITGRLVRNVELHTSEDGKNFWLNNCVAVNRTQKDKDGNYPTDYIEIKAFGGQAQALSKYASKGTLVAISGELQTGSYQNNAGVRVNTFAVLVRSLDIMEHKKADNNENEENVETTNNNFNVKEVSEDDLPF